MTKYNANTMITAKALKEALKKSFVSAKAGATRYQVKDTTKGNSQGYDFELALTRFETKEFGADGVVCTTLTDWFRIETVARSFEAWDVDGVNVMKGRGCFRSCFLKSDVAQFVKI